MRKQSKTPSLVTVLRRKVNLTLFYFIVYILYMLAKQCENALVDFLNR